MKTFFTRQNVTIILVIVLVVFVIYSRTGLEMSEGDKARAKELVNVNQDNLADQAFLILSQIEKLTDDEKIHEAIMNAASAGDKETLYEIIDGL
jgi:mannitol/fructose-specific phosphotransferase system IIA component (Ntr-type)